MAQYASEEKLKEQAQQNLQAQAGYAGNAKICGLAGLDETKRAGLNGRIAAQLQRASRESRHIEALRELSYLLEKNPEVARILDLMDAVREY